MRKKSPENHIVNKISYVFWKRDKLEGVYFSLPKSIRDFVNNMIFGNSFAKRFLQNRTKFLVGAFDLPLWHCFTTHWLKGALSTNTDILF